MTNQEITRRLAEDVMGWEECGESEEECKKQDGKTVFEPWTKERGIAGWKNKNTFFMHKVNANDYYGAHYMWTFSPLTSDSDCWMVVDKFRDGKRYITCIDMATFIITEIGDKWLVRIEYGVGDAIIIEHESRRHAICLAIIEAVEKMK